MVEKVLTKTTFIGGRLMHAGDVVDVDAIDPTIVVPAPSTPIGNMTVAELRAALRRAEENAEPEPLRFSSNVTDPVKGAVGVSEQPIADVTVRSPGSTQPQGAPPGSVATGEGYITPTPDGQAGREVATAPLAADPASATQPAGDPTQELDPNTGGPKSFERMNKAELIDYLGADSPAPDGATKAVLIEAAEEKARKLRDEAANHPSITQPAV